MPDAHYTHPRLTAIYDLDSPWGKDTDFYLAEAGNVPLCVLDLGCGTGTLGLGLAKAGHRVTGVDPAAAMLSVAASKAEGAEIPWVCSSAQDYVSEQCFDLIVMTGHAFQVLLTDDDVLSTFATMRKHLAPDGRAIFESRNPAIDWNQRWRRSFVWELAEGPVRQTRCDVAVKGERLSFTHTYEFPDETLVSSSTLSFRSIERITALLQQSGLSIQAVYGDWDRRPFVEADSEEMIFVVSAADHPPGTSVETQ